MDLTLSNSKYEKFALDSNCYIDFKKLVCVKNNLPCALTHIDIRLLERFCANLGRVTKYDELLSVFYDDITINELSVYITRLRKKIESNPRSPKHLISVKGVGYVLIATEDAKSQNMSNALNK